MKTVFLEVVQTYGGARKSTIELAHRLSSYSEVEVWDLYGSCIPFVAACNDYNLKLRILCHRETPIVLSTLGIFWKLINGLKFLRDCYLANRHILELANREPCCFIVNNSKALTLLFRKPVRSNIILFARGWFLPQQVTFKDKLLYKKYVDKYVCVSEATRHALHCSGLADLDDLFVVHNAIDIDQIFRDINILKRTASLQILLSGGFLPAKGQKVAIEVAKRLRDMGVDFKIVICGIIYKGSTSQKWCDYIADLIKKENLEERVELVINHHNVIEYFRWCDIFIHPSDTEGLPRVVMEAMALRKPVVANAVGGVTDYILNDFTGFLTRHNNIDDYIEFIMKLYCDKFLYKRIAENAYNLVSETFTEKAQLEQMRKVLNYE